MQHPDIETDVVVVGAGAAGLPAAIGAARAGAKVVLLEEDPALGGAPSDCYVCLPYGRPISGVMAEMVHLLSTKHSPTSRAWFFLPSAYQRAWREMIEAEPNLRVIAGAEVVGVLHGRGTGSPQVMGVSVQVLPGATFDVKGKVTIDCSGSGFVSEMAGATVMYGRDARKEFGEPHAPEKADDRVQACTWMYFAQGIVGTDTIINPPGVHVNVGIPERGDEHLPQPPAVMPGKKDPQLYLNWGCAVACRDTRDPLALAETQNAAYDAIEPDLRRLEKAGYTVHLAPRIGVRECRRIRGEHVLTENDIVSGAFPPDTIAVADYGFDDWRSDKHEELGASTARYGIPYRAILPAGVEGMLVAGKCMSGTHIAQSSFRVMPIVAGAGQAAGVAGALSATRAIQPRQLDPDDLRKALRGDRQHLQLSFDEQQANA